MVKTVKKYIFAFKGVYIGYLKNSLKQCLWYEWLSLLGLSYRKMRKYARSEKLIEKKNNGLQSRWGRRNEEHLKWLDRWGEYGFLVMGSESKVGAGI